MLLARIREADCVGCTKCIDACPVDAIVGAQGFMHTVIIQDCIGCRLCIDPCPMDCIELQAIPTPSPAEKSQKAALAKQHHQARQQRLSRQRQALLLPPDTPEHEAKIRSDIAAAFERVANKRKGASLDSWTNDK